MSRETLKASRDRLLREAYARWVAPRVQRAFFHDLIRKTENFGHLTWLGEPIWQNVLDLWTTQEVIGRIKPDLLIECGTLKGGSSRFFANLFDLMDHGRCITIDVEEQSFPRHERVTYLHGSTMDPEILEQVEKVVRATDGPIMVMDEVTAATLTAKPVTRRQPRRSNAAHPPRRVQPTSSRPVRSSAGWSSRTPWRPSAGPSLSHAGSSRRMEQAPLGSPPT